MARIQELETNNVAVGLTSAQLLAAQPMRTWLHIQNNGANTAYIRFGTAAASSTTGIKIVSGAEITIENPGVGAIQAIVETLAQDLIVTTNKVPLT